MNLWDDLLTPIEEEQRFYGVVIGIVTNNKDPDWLGRVKVKFPWLSEDDESDWARVAMPMSGNQMGVFFLPDVGDEVLVSFDQGMVDHPYVLGSLWNGKDKPPVQNRDGKNNLRLIKSRSGHIIRLDDKDGDEKIEIIDKSGRNSIVISSAEDSITITTRGNLSLKAEGDISLDSKSGNVVLSGNEVEIKAKTAVKAESQTMMDFKSNGQLTIKGQLVNIN